METLLRRLRSRREAHLRDGHLRHIDEDLEIAASASHRRRGDRRLEVIGCNAETEVHPPAARDRARDLGCVREIGNDDLRPQRTQRGRAIVVTTDEPSHGQLPLEQSLHDGATDAADGTARTGHENRRIVHRGTSRARRGATDVPSHD
jgi:hypothetical protein